MWPFKKTPSLDEARLLDNFTDWHSHILPGVDDGIRDLDSSLEVLREYDRKGVKELWLTPHIMEDYPNTTADLRQRFVELSNAWDGNVKLNLASENMLDSLFEDRLAKGDLLPIGSKGDHLLVETSYFSAPMNMEDLIDKIFSAGLFPVLAHPERYRYMTEKDYLKWKEKGVKFQVNFVSVVGGYGETARKKSEWLLRHDMIDLAGSDLHRLASIQKLMQDRPSKHDVLDRLLKVRDNGGI